MSIEIKIPDSDTEFLNQPAGEELVSVVNSYIDELLKESSRLEAAQNTTGGNPEITSSMIKDASVFLKRGYKKPKKPIWLTVSQIVAAIFTLLTGMLLDLDLLKDPQMLALFIVFLFVATTFTILVILKE